MALLLGQAAETEGIVYDDFTGSNGTSLDSYGKWSKSGGGSATIQSNQGQISGTNTSITSLLAAAQSFVQVTGSAVNTGSTSGTISIFGVSISMIRTGGTNYAQSWVFTAVNVGGTWFKVLRGTNTSGSAVDQHGNASSGTSSAASPTEFSIGTGGSQPVQLTFDNVYVL